MGASGNSGLGWLTVVIASGKLVCRSRGTHFASYVLPERCHRMCELIERVQDCTSECPTEIICSLKEDQSEFLEERGQMDLVNEFTDLDNQ